MSYPHVKHTASIRQRMGVGLLQVLAGAGNVEGNTHHLESKFLGCLKQVPRALQREAKGHAGLCGVGKGGQLQQQPNGNQNRNETSNYGHKLPQNNTPTLHEKNIYRGKEMLLLCIWMQTGYLEQLGLIFTHKFLNVVLGCILDVCLLLANT